MRIIYATAILLACYGSTSADAQVPAQSLALPAPDSQNRGLITAPYTSSLGRVRPPGRSFDPEFEGRLQRRTPDLIRDDIIDRSICIGCD